MLVPLTSMVPSVSKSQVYAVPFVVVPVLVNVNELPTKHWGELLIVNPAVALLPAPEKPPTVLTYVLTQPFASVTVNVYSPSQRPEISSLVEVNPPGPTHE